MKAPAFQLYAADFYMDTVGWSCEEVGLYFRLLMAEWVNGSIPNDIEKIARIGGCIENRQWRANVERMWSELSKKFVTLPDGNLVNVRLEETREKQKLFIENQREKGKIRAGKRWEGHIATATKRLQPEDKPENGSSSSSSSSTSNNKKHIASSYPEDFESFFKSYPKRTAKKGAFAEWKKAKATGQLPPLESLLSAIENQKRAKQAAIDTGQFTPEWPDPERWIKKARWDDEIIEPQDDLEAWKNA